MTSKRDGLGPAFKLPSNYKNPILFLIRFPSYHQITIIPFFFLSDFLCVFKGDGAPKDLNSSKSRSLPWSNFLLYFVHFCFHPQGRGQQRALAFFSFFAIYCIILHMRLCIVRISPAISLACVTQVDLQLWRHVLYYNCLLLWHITYNKMLPTSEGIDVAIMCLNCFMRTTRLPGQGGGCCWYFWCSGFDSTVGKKARVSLSPWVPSPQTILSQQRRMVQPWQRCWWDPAAPASYRTWT